VLETAGIDSAPVEVQVEPTGPSSSTKKAPSPCQNRLSLESGVTAIIGAPRSRRMVRFGEITKIKKTLNTSYPGGGVSVEVLTPAPGSLH
jgi:hypothetical protein